MEYPQASDEPTVLSTDIDIQSLEGVHFIALLLRTGISISGTMAVKYYDNTGMF